MRNMLVPLSSEMLPAETNALVWSGLSRTEVWKTNECSKCNGIDSKRCRTGALSGRIFVGWIGQAALPGVCGCHSAPHSPRRAPNSSAPWGSH